MAARSTKEILLDIAENLPADAPVEDAMERLYFPAKIERGVEHADAGQTIDHEDVRNRLDL